MDDKVIASVATQYVRRHGLCRVINDLLQQVSELHVYLNDYPETYYEDWMQHYTGLYIHRAHMYYGDLADNGKFVLDPKRYPQSYFATVDDDLLYPNDYIRTMVAACKAYDNKAVVSMHGAILHDRVTNYYKDRTVYGHNLRVPSNVSVHVVGTGCMMFHTDAYHYDPMQFIDAPKRMSDIVFSAAAMDAGLYRYVLQHDRSWLPQNYAQSAKESIMHRFATHNPHLVKYIGERSWWR